MRHGHLREEPFRQREPHSKGPGAGSAVRAGHVGEPSTAGPRGPPGLTLPPPGLRAAGLSLFSTGV